MEYIHSNSNKELKECFLNCTYICRLGQYIGCMVAFFLLLDITVCRISRYTHGHVIYEKRKKKKYLNNCLFRELMVSTFENYLFRKFCILFLFVKSYSLHH